MDYINLGIVLDYTLLNSLVKIDNLVEYANNNNIKVLGILNDNLYSTMEFYTKCKNNNWLSDNGSLWYTTLTAVFADPLSVFITYGDNGVITVDRIQYPKATKPTLYLSPNVKIISGTGTSTDPYILG